MFFRLKPPGPRTYLQIAENRREDGAQRRHVLATLGRANELAASGAPAALLATGARLCDQVMLLSALGGDADGPRLSTRRICGPLLFERLWGRRDAKRGSRYRAGSWPLLTLLAKSVSDLGADQS